MLAEKVNGGEEGYNTACYLLTADVELNDTADMESWTENAPEYRWIAIGDYRRGKARFEGTFDGGGHVISGMFCYGEDTINTQEEGNFYLGLFGKLQNASVKNVTLSQSCLIGKGQVEGMGGIAADAWDSELTGCVSEAYMDCENATYGAGGVVGYANRCKLTDCEYAGSISFMGSNVGYCGGIAGYLSASTVENCVNKGTVAGAGSAGGIAGDLNHADMENPSVLTGCVNSGTVTGQNGRVGGIVGDLWNGYGKVTVKECTNEGTVSSNGETGGLFGYVTSCKSFVDNKEGNVGTVSIEDCFNQGSVNLLEDSLSGTAGGICGTLAASDGAALTLLSCRNQGTVNAQAHVAGGMAGSLLLNYSGEVTVEGCVNEGAVFAADGCFGGIVAMTTQTVDDDGLRMIRIADCSNQGVLSGKGWNGGGILGMVTLLSRDDDSFTVTGCTNSGSLTGESSGSMIELGGVIGGMITTNGTLAVTDCRNSGAITLKVTAKEDKKAAVASVAGGIIGSHAENVQISGCENTGVISTEGGDDTWLTSGEISGMVKSVYSMEEVEAAVAERED